MSTKPIRKRVRTSGAPARMPDRAPAKREMRATVYDWDTIRAEFIEGVPIPDSKDEREWLNLKELSEKHDVPYLRVRKVASKERWTERRQAAQDIATLERAKVRASKIAKNALDFDERAHEIAKTGLSLVQARMAELGQDMIANRALREDALNRKRNGQPYKDKELYASIRYSEIDGLASAAARFQELGMKALGTDVKKIDLTAEGVGQTEITVNIGTEMQRDDPERLATMLGAMHQAGLVPDEVMQQLEAGDTDDDPEVIDAEFTEEGQSDGAGEQGVTGNGA